MSAFFSALDANFFQHHLIRCRFFAQCRANFQKGQIDEQTKQTPEWSSEWFRTKKFAAFSIEIELSDGYNKKECKEAKKSKQLCAQNKATVEIGPNPAFYWLFRQEFARNATRLWVDFSTKNLRECSWLYDASTSREKMSNELDSILFGDQRLVDELIRWLSEPLPPRLPLETPTNFDSFNWQPPTLTGCERILHIGNERGVLNMALVGNFIQTLVDVCFEPIVYIVLHV